MLRRIAAEGPAWYAALPDDDPEEAALRHSLPDWIAETWFDAYGEERGRALCEAANRPPALSLWPNPLLDGIAAVDAWLDARMLTEWSDNLSNTSSRFVVCSGGGPGIMEAANRGAADAQGKTIGLNIGLPFEQLPNPYITPELSFEFHYFFMRKFWFAYLAKALVVFPGGFGTLDEMMEILTLTQTQKLAKKVTTVLYGSAYWKEIINFDALLRHGMIAPEDMALFQYADDPTTAFEILKEGLLRYAMQPDTPETPAIAKSRNPQKPAGA